ncbi:xanthine dehydrogenase [Deinococcus irradiatisoli]|uniref:Xanthine dehydrogenase n=1 Tax=Deinococcus irradiatisoli TaxID=2202254 RepID=A0A2Z3JQ02_9DEIO|nr:XdhC/CoxI family protein [Deinococcus irradiatisoli]AWN23084.1 xanthine dehydrogenase [Deinococcus irradiatisoli]
MERLEINEILAGLRAAEAAGQGAALASVVRVRGNAYRREGARMLIREDGTQVCMLSGGCLEAEVALSAQEVIAQGQPSLTGYDLSEDVTWGLGIGCGGSVDIYVEPVRREDPLLHTWLGLLERGELGVLATLLPAGASGVPAAPLGRLLMRDDGTVQEGEPGVPDAALRTQIVAAGQEMLRALYPRAETRRFSTGDRELDVFLDASAPAPELVIFGAGHDAMPLSARAVEVGWQVKVVDARPAFLTPGRFPGAELIEAAPEQLGAHLNLGPRSFAMVMNHHVERDRVCLRFALESEAPYIGVLGPRQRFLDALDVLRAEGAAPSAEQLGRVSNPVGLNIGAESPQEVALSVMAELIAVRRGFAGGRLNGRSGRIHDPADRPSTSAALGAVN